MSAGTDAIEREIAGVRETLGSQLSEAEAKAREVIDWRTHYRRNPMPMLAAAAAVGFAASALIGDEQKGDSTPSGIQFHQAASLGTASINGAMEKMIDAFVVAASVKAAEYIERWLPGFHQEFSRRQG